MNSLPSFLTTFTCIFLVSCASQSEKTLFLKIADESLALGNSDAAINFYDKAFIINLKCICFNSIIRSITI